MTEDRRSRAMFIANECDALLQKARLALGAASCYEDTALPSAATVPPGVVPFSNQPLEAQLDDIALHIKEALRLNAARYDSPPEEESVAVVSRAVAAPDRGQH